jgi:hypothetical protein
MSFKSKAVEAYLWAKSLYGDDATLFDYLADQELFKFPNTATKCEKINQSSYRVLDDKVPPQNYRTSRLSAVIRIDAKESTCEK